MVTMNGNDKHRCSGGAPGKDAIAPEIPGGLPHAVACDGPQPGFDGRTPLLPAWAAAAIASDPPGERPGLSPRTRIRMTALGAARCPNLAGREGVVIGMGRYRSTVRVMFDGFRSATSLHSTYIEPVDGEDGPSSQDRR
jgi:hypothetical protein